MPQSNNPRRDLVRLVLFTFAAWALWALGRNDAKPGAVDETETAQTPRKRSGFSKRRLATSIAFTTIFFAGAAFTAGAVGEKVCDLGDVCEGVTTVADPPQDPATPPPVESVEDESGTGGSESTEPVPTPPPPVQESSNGEQTQGESGASGEDQDVGDDEDPGTSTSEDDAAPASGAGEDPSDDNASGNDNGSGGGGGGGQSAEEPDSPAAGPSSESHAGDGQSSSHDDAHSPVDVDAAHDAAVDAENSGSFGTFWLHRTLPDPTPPARRLEPRFARTLLAVSRSQHVDWALVLGVVRAHGNRTSVPATKAQLRAVATNLRKLHASRGAWQAVLALEGRTAFADRAIALRNYNRAVGLRTLVRGLVASKDRLQDRVLADKRIAIYSGGRTDIATGRVDVRVLALLRYLAEAHGQVTVSCLISGHGLYARPGVISAHIYGLAVDISALGGVSIYGNQQPGGLTEKAVRNILLLPVELRPKQVISLLGLGGPSFALANHYDHIHVGY
jgi:hypothetical protein